MSMRSQIIRLAHQDDSLRPHLLRLLKASSDKNDVNWAIRRLKRPGQSGSEDLKDIVDVLDRQRGGPSLYEDNKEIGDAVRRLRRMKNPDGRDLLKVLQKHYRKMAGRPTAPALYDVAKEDVNKLRDAVERAGFTQIKYQEFKPGRGYFGKVEIEFKGVKGKVKLAWMPSFDVWSLDSEDI